jgi:hypothetical protein
VNGVVHDVEHLVQGVGLRQTLGDVPQPFELVQVVMQVPGGTGDFLQRIPRGSLYRVDQRLLVRNSMTSSSLYCMLFRGGWESGDRLIFPGYAPTPIVPPFLLLSTYRRMAWRESRVSVVEEVP